MPGSATDGRRSFIVDTGDMWGTWVRTAMESDARPTSMRTGWLDMAPSKALQPAPCVTKMRISSSSSSTSTCALGLEDVPVAARGTGNGGDGLFDRTLNMKPGICSFGGSAPCTPYHRIKPAMPLRKRLCMVLHSSPYSPPSPQSCGGRMLSHWKSTWMQAS